jgi:hypothetical protein
MRTLVSLHAADDAAPDDAIQEGICSIWVVSVAEVTYGGHAGGSSQGSGGLESVNREVSACTTNEGPPIRGGSGAASGAGRVVMTYLRAASCAAVACFGVSTDASFSLYSSSGLPWLNMPPRFDMLAVPRWMLTCGDGMSGRMQSKAQRLPLRDVSLVYGRGLVRSC